jgi:dolichyl-phosphate-mannose--protein O-mannosyl transferase
LSRQQPFWLWRNSPFQWAIAVIFLLGLLLRFWKLSQFNVLVFDEVYYAKFANDYWLGKPFFPSHPPLSHYLIALGMAVGSLFPASPDTVNILTGSLHSTWSYRWLNALTGSFVPLLVGAIAYELTSRRRFTLIIMALAALDGLFLVESRYALNNIYLIFFGLLGHLYFFYFINRKKGWYLTLAGIFLSCAGTVKWNGFGFLLGIYY